MKSKSLSCSAAVCLFAAIFFASIRAAETPAPKPADADIATGRGVTIHNDGSPEKKNIAPTDIVKKDQTADKMNASAPNMHLIPESIYEKYAIDLKTSGVAVSFMRPGMPAVTTVLPFTQASEVANIDGSKKITIKMTDGRMLDVLVAKDGGATFLQAEKKTGAMTETAKPNFAKTGGGEPSTKSAQ